MGSCPDFVGLRSFRRKEQLAWLLFDLTDQSVVGRAGPSFWLGAADGPEPHWCECLLRVCRFSLRVWLSQPSVSEYQECCYVQLLTGVRLFVTPRTVARPAFLSFSISWSLFKPMSIESVMPSDHLILCCPLLNLSQHRGPCQ